MVDPAGQNAELVDCYILGWSELAGRWAAACLPRSPRTLAPLMRKVEEMSCN